MILQSGRLHTDNVFVLREQVRFLIQISLWDERIQTGQGRAQLLEDLGSLQAEIFFTT